MRTTLDIDDDVLLAVKERARREKRSAGRVLSELARAALTHPTRPAPAEEPVAFHGFAPFARRGPAVSNALIERLREDEAI
jgi:hypothetical protein